MRRGLVVVVVFVFVFVFLLLPAIARAEGDPRAEALNEEGKALYLDKKDYAAAAAKFRAAIAIERDARYAYNLCAALERRDDLDGALAACEDAKAQSPRPELADKAQRRIEEIRRWQARDKDGPSPEPVVTLAQSPASADLYSHPAADYTWSLGVDLGLVANGSLGIKGDYKGAGGLLRVHADILLFSQLGIFLEPYLDFASFDGSGHSSSVTGLAMSDLGLAFAWQRRIAGGLSFTPAVGIFLGGLRVAGPSDTYLAIGLRADLAFEWAFGEGHHVLSLVPLGLTVYGDATGQIAGTTTAPATYGLDKGGVTLGFLIGYRYRFQTAKTVLLF